jgi:hypothetical protein
MLLAVAVVVVVVVIVMRTPAVCALRLVVLEVVSQYLWP